ncbi:hypothetical protein O6H91_02G101300 [Diphasiastrum complanatum]|uniref:Uncharacterized protein n=1 Tax=Diphasiastrum complanatum TaxID=34168 RepID=A0ACC2EJ44_DIPCM|nr:hypothetical protein O6H91_02G101300 [Diphasiastrum complanatum]
MRENYMVDMERGCGLALLLAIAAIAAACASDSNNICQWHGEVPKMQRRIIDISHAYRHDLPVWDSSTPLGSPVHLQHSFANGSLFNLSELKMGCHTGTHVDAPSHFLQEAYEEGLDVNSLDLEILNAGLVLLVDTPREENITAHTMEKLNIPFGVERVLFRTLNSDRRLMWRTNFESSFSGFTKDGAQWLVDHTSIKLVGLDYLSVATYEEAAETHRILLRKGIILLEGLDLDDIEVGIYVLHCLPMRLINAEGSPIRCILTK